MNQFGGNSSIHYSVISIPSNAKYSDVRILKLLDFFAIPKWVIMMTKIFNRSIHCITEVLEFKDLKKNTNNSSFL